MRHHQSRKSVTPSPLSCDKMGGDDLFFRVNTIRSAHSTHLLFYGLPGVGKTQLAQSLVQAAGVAAYEVLPESPGISRHSGSHRGNLLMASNFTGHGT